MRKILIVSALALMVFASTSSATQIWWYENFEQTSLAPEWTVWTQTGTNGSAIASENPQLGDPPNTPRDLPNEKLANLTGGTPRINGGIWTIVSGLPVGMNLKIDGWWRLVTWAGNNAWAEVIVIDSGVPVNGQDYNIPADLEYKADSFGGPAQGSTGKFDSTMANVKRDGWFTTTDGTVCVLLKIGSGTGVTTVQFDDVCITPEPATALLFGLPCLALLRRRRA